MANYQITPKVGDVIILKDFQICGRNNMSVSLRNSCIKLTVYLDQIYDIQEIKPLTMGELKNGKDNNFEGFVLR